MLIEPILGYKSVWRILSLLFETPRKLVSRKELFVYTKLGNAPLSNGLKRLLKANIIIQERKNKKEFYYINQDSEYTKLLMEIWRKEKSDLRYLEYDIKLIISEFIRALIEFPDIKKIVLFGSWAKGTASTSSDIDLMLLFDKELGNELEITRIVRNLNSQFNKEIQIHCYTEKSFSIKNKLTDEIKRDGIIILG